MKMRPLRLAAGAGALAAGTVAGSAALLAPEAVAETPPAPPSAPLTLTDVASADLYGAPVTFTLTVANPSATIAATEVQLSDVLPAGVAYVPPPPPPPPPSTSTTSTTSTTTPAVPPPYVPPAPTVTAGPNGTTTLHWNGLEDIPAGGKLSVSFAAQAATAPAPSGLSAPAPAAGVPAAPVYLPGSVFADQASLSADGGSPQSATASAAVTVSTVSLAQSATPLPAGVSSGPVIDTIDLQGAPDSETDTIGVDLYLPPSVSLGICPAAPAPCSQPSVISDLNALAGSDGTPSWPLSAGNTKFVDLHWSVASLAARAHLDLAVPLNVTNPTSATAQTPIVLAVLTATAPVVAPGASLPEARSAVAVGTLPPPPVTTTTSVKPAKALVRPSGDRATLHKVVPTPVAAPPAAASLATAARATAAAGPAQKVNEAIVSSGSNPSPFATPAASGAAPTPAPSSVSPAAGASAGRDPFIGPGQKEVVSAPAAQKVGVGTTVSTTSSSPQATSTSGLAYTGLDATELASLAAGLLLAGGALVFSTRRRPASQG